MILLFARNDEVAEALEALAAEGLDRKEILVRNSKYPGAEIYQLGTDGSNVGLTSWRGERFREVVAHPLAPRLDEIRDQAGLAEIPFRVLEIVEPEPMPDIVPGAPSRSKPEPFEGARRRAKAKRKTKRS